MSTIFSKIIRGEIPSHRIAETDKFFAFLDINPVQRGHTLVVPKREEDYFFDLSDDEISSIMLFARVVASAIQKATNASRIGISVMGLEVNHAHVHLVPISEPRDMDMYCKIDMAQEELAEVASQIRAFIPEEYR